MQTKEQQGERIYWKLRNAIYNEKLEMEWAGKLCKLTPRDAYELSGELTQQQITSLLADVRWYVSALKSKRRVFSAIALLSLIFAIATGVWVSSWWLSGSGYPQYLVAISPGILVFMLLRLSDDGTHRLNLLIPILERISARAEFENT